MKIAMFKDKESYVQWLTNEIDAIRKNGLRTASENYEAALRGEGKEQWMQMNNTDSEDVWNDHLEWMRGQIAYLERKIKKYEREIAKNK